MRRTFAIAAVVGAALALRRREPWLLLLPSTAQALWFSLGGHYVEVFFLNALRPRIPRARLVQVSARFAVWFVGGVVLFLCMAASSRLLPFRPPPLRGWWLGGLLFVGIELVVHVTLVLRRLPNFYAGSA